MALAGITTDDVVAGALEQAHLYPRLRYMGSKYQLLSPLAEIFRDLDATTALDPFSGSGVVSYLMKALGLSVSSQDYLAFPTVLAQAACVNQEDQLSDEELASIATGSNLDGRDFISRTYEGLFFTDDDRAFLDAAWSRIGLLEGPRRALAISSLVLAAARKQPRGVFTVTGLRYDDGRAQLHTPLREQFVSCAHAWNRAVFRGPRCSARRGDVSEAPPGADLVYLDPPYAPPKDDNDYLKRYWFLEGLADYWDDGEATVMEETRTHKLPKRPTAFGSKRTISSALTSTFEQFSDSTIVLSYGSNAVPGLDALCGMLAEVKGSRPEVMSLKHRYHFGTHSNASRRQALEYLIVAS